MHDNLRRTQKYGITYISSPTKSYVIEPKGGEINYDLAKKDPLKFYDKVMQQDITEHKVRRSKAFRQEQNEAR